MSATRSSWKTHEPPAERAALDFQQAYNRAEFELIKAGLIPVEMEDKWFVFFEAPWLYIHRSWTGFCIYGVRFEESSNGAAATEAWVNRNTEQYDETRTDYDEKLVKFLIEALLLKKRVAFPVPPSRPPQQSIWRRIRTRLS